MTPSFLILAWSLLLFGQDPAPAIVDAKEPVVEALVIQHEVTGRPGSPDESTVVQSAFVASDRVLVDDRSRGLIRVLRLDQQNATLWEIAGDRSVYREISDLGKIQQDRLQQERQLIERISSLPEKEREELLQGNFLKVSENGQLVREVQVKEAATDEKRLDLPVRKVQIFENERLIADLLVADIDMPFSLARFHAATGAFSAEVLSALEKVQGLPLEGTIQVVTATLTHPLHFRVTQWTRSTEVPASLFELPEGCVKIEESSFVHCPVCGSEVEREASAARARKRDGTWYYFDRRECFQDWRKQRIGNN